jgi:hypothetical protein
VRAAGGWACGSGGWRGRTAYRTPGQAYGSGRLVVPRGRVGLGGNLMFIRFFKVELATFHQIDNHVIEGPFLLLRHGDNIVEKLLRKVYRYPKVLVVGRITNGIL